MGNKMDKILAEISAGELIDKITILEIKMENILDKNKLIDVKKELKSLNDTMKIYIPNKNEIIRFKEELKEINEKLWGVENEKRAAEKKTRFWQIFCYPCKKCI